MKGVESISLSQYIERNHFLIGRTLPTYRLLCNCRIKKDKWEKKSYYL